MPKYLQGVKKSDTPKVERHTHEWSNLINSKLEADTARRQALAKPGRSHTDVPGLTHVEAPFAHGGAVGAANERRIRESGGKGMTAFGKKARY